MSVISVNVGTPKQVQAGNRTVLTSIFKKPIEGRVAVRKHNIEGDRQADLTVHGGPYKAVYCYPSEHYSFWKEQLPAVEFTLGMFGENLTTEGLDEKDVCIGDQIRVGSATLQVTQPRMPCYKLALRFGLSDMVKRFWHSGLPGIYFSIVEEGDVAAGDRIERVARMSDAISVSDVVALYRGQKFDADLMKRALNAPLFGSWKKELRERLNFS